MAAREFGSYIVTDIYIIFLSFDICLTVHHWYKNYRQPTICKNNGLLIIPISSISFGRLFRPSSGALNCVLSLWCLRFQATGRQHRGCIVPQAVTHSLVLLKMGGIIARNILSSLELLINRYCCTWLVVYIIYINDARSSKYQRRKDLIKGVTEYYRAFWSRWPVSTSSGIWT